MSLVRVMSELSWPGFDLQMDAVIMVVGHRQFREMRISEIRGLMNDHPVLVDLKGIGD